MTPEERLADIRETRAAPVPTDLTGAWVHRMWLSGLPRVLAEIEQEMGVPGLAAREMERVRDAGLAV